MGYLRVADASFQVAVAEIMCFCDEDQGGLCWSIEVRCHEGPLSTYAVRPKAQCDVAMVTSRYLEDWRSLFPARAEPSDPADADEDPAAVLYVVEHQAIRENIIEMVLTEGSKVLTHWTGRCDVMMNDRYAQNLDLSIEATSVFVGAPIGSRSEREGRRELEPYLNLSQFDFRVIDGVSRFVPR